MRVYLQPPQPLRGLQRIADALARYAPSTVQVFNDPTLAQLTVIYAIGRRDAITRQVQELLEQGKQYAVIQVCLRSTMSPNTYDWIRIWRTAKVVWSYYDLDAAINADTEPLEGFDGYHHLPNFLHAPLGVDSSVFYPRQVWKMFTIATSGVSRLQESVRECVLASEAVDGRVFHVGQVAPSWQGINKFADDMSDDELAIHYSACHFVSGLRRTEGFELPAAEGLLCGARPILFDSADYRFNYKDWGLYIREGSRQEVVDQLVDIFKQGAEPVTTYELEEARHWFNWERVCGEFWNRCLQ